MTKELRQEMVRLRNYFFRNKKKVIKALIVSLLFFVAAMAFAGLKAFYPLHFVFSFISLLFSLKFFVKMFLFDKRKVARSNMYLVSKRFLGRHKRLGILLLILFLVGYVLWTVIPSGNPFSGLTAEERAQLVRDDIEISTVLLDNMELSGNELIHNPLLQKKSLTADESRELKEKWNLFLSIAQESEKVTEVHKYFTRINIFGSPAQHAQSFAISYSLYIKKFELFHRLIGKIDGNDLIIRQLNEYSPFFGGKDSYDDVLDRFFSSQSLVRRNVGRAYLLLLKVMLPNSLLSDGFFVLEGESIKSHSYLLYNVFSTGIGAAKEKRYRLEKDLSNLWFPVQKNVANMMGNSYVSRRHEKFISMDQIVEMKKALEPGDILVQRRNWYASNIGIPGFWAHAALYTGTMTDLNAYFSEIFPIQGHANASDLIRSQYPEVWEKMHTRDVNQYEHAVIEGQSPGIILQSLEKSAHADYLGVLRARLSKTEKFRAILRAFENYGKPYDYNFDFETTDELVCSELIYDAYQPMSGTKGIKFDLNLTSGRKIISPNDMVRKYYIEKKGQDRELDFVYFLDGNEELERAFVKDESAFELTWQRPKYSWYQE